MLIEVISLIIAAAAFVSSVLSPVAVALINNGHARKMYILQERETESRAAIREFIETLSSYINMNGHFANDDDYIRLIHSTGKMYLYVPQENWDYLDTVANDVCTHSGIDEIKAGFYPFCKSIASNSFTEERKK